MCTVIVLAFPVCCEIWTLVIIHRSFCHQQFVYLCICVIVYLCICVLMCICVFVYCISIPSLLRNLDSGNYSSVVLPPASQRPPPTGHCGCKLILPQIFKLGKQIQIQIQTNTDKYKCRQLQTNTDKYSGHCGCKLILPQIFKLHKQIQTNIQTNTITDGSIRLD